MMRKHVKTATKKPQMTVLRALLSFFGSGCMEDFRQGWQEGVAKEKAKQQAKAAETEKLRLQKAAETQDKGDDSDGRIKCIVPNTMLKGTCYDNPYTNPEIGQNPYGFTEL